VLALSYAVAQRRAFESDRYAFSACKYYDEIVHRSAEKDFSSLMQPGVQKAFESAVLYDVGNFSAHVFPVTET